MEIELTEMIAPLGAAAPAVVMFGAIACGLLCLPVGPWVIASGFLFGLPFGATLGVFVALGVAFVNFTIARRFGSTTFDRWSRKRRGIVRRALSFGDDSMWALSILRLSPIVSWPVVSYAVGFSRMRFRPYAMSSLALLPLVFAYSWAGAMARELGGMERNAVLELVRDWAVPAGAGLVALAILAAVRVGPPVAKDVCRIAEP